MSSVVYDPTAPRRTEALQDRLSLETLSGKVVGFIDNSKPNFNHLIDRMAELLQSRYGVKSVVRHRKLMASIPASRAILDDVADKCDLVVTGAGD